MLTLFFVLGVYCLCMKGRYRVNGVVAGMMRMMGMGYSAVWGSLLLKQTAVSYTPLANPKLSNVMDTLSLPLTAVVPVMGATVSQGTSVGVAQVVS
jgi:hypothetical protein